MTVELILYCIILCAFLGDGIAHGFSVPIVFGIILLLAIHHRADFLPQKNAKLNAVFGVDLHNTRMRLSAMETDVRAMQDKLNQVQMMAAFRTGGAKPIVGANT